MTVFRGFMRKDLFTGVHEQFFFTDTTTYPTSFCRDHVPEHKDLNKAYGHTYLQNLKPGD